MDIRKNDFKIELDEGEIRGFEKNVLALNTCKYFMPMSFMNMNSKDIVKYDCSGYVSLSQRHDIKIRELLDIVEKTFMILNKTGEYLILPSRVTLNEETVFYNKEKNQVKIAYVPVNTEESSLRKNMTEFIKILEDKAPKEMKGYLADIREHLDKNNYYITDILNLICQMKRELHICKIE